MTILQLVEHSEVSELADLSKVVTEQINIIFKIFRDTLTVQDPEEIASLEIPASENFNLKDNRLRSNYELIRRHKQITKQPFNAFVLSSYNLKPDDLNRHLVMQAWIILAAHRFLERRGFTVKIQQAFNAFRLINLDANCEDLRRQLPYFESIDDKIITELRNLKDKHESLKHRLYPIISLFEHYFRNSSSYQPRKASHPRNCKDHKPKRDYEQVSSSLATDTNEHSSTEFLHSPTSDYSIDIDEQERNLDQKSKARFFSFDLIAPNDVMRSLSLQSQLMKAAANNIQRKEKQLTCDYRQLTNFDVSCLIKYCFQNARRESACVYLVISLLTARNLITINQNIDLLKISKNAALKDQPVWLHWPKLPKHEVEAPLEKLLQRPNGAVILLLPKQLEYEFQKLRRNNLDPALLLERAQAVIKTINEKSKTRLTLSRIVNYLPFYLNNHGVDATENALLVGKGTQVEPGVSYYQVNVRQLLLIHRKFVCHTLKLANYNELDSIDLTTVKTVGSYLQVKIDKASKMFALLQLRLNELRTNNWSNLEEFHNVYTIFVLNLLNLGTGHRPVQQPYETLACFDFESSTVHLSDKELRSTLASRVLVLPDIATTQVKNYIRHLEVIFPYLGNVNIETGKQVGNALASTGPLFFFLKKGKFYSVTPAAISKYSRDIFPIKLNWHRHFMRTALRRLGIEGNIVDAWMGHVSSEGDAFARYSGVSMADLRRVAKKINTLMSEELNVSPESPWGR